MSDDRTPSRREPVSHPSEGAPEHATAGPTLHQGDEAAPGTPGTGEDVCQLCEGRGSLPSGEACPDCDGSGRIIQGIGGG